MCCKPILFSPPSPAVEPQQKMWLRNLSHAPWPRDLLPLQYAAMTYHKLARTEKLCHLICPHSSGFTVGCLTRINTTFWTSMLISQFPRTARFLWTVDNISRLSFLPHLISGECQKEQGGKCGNDSEKMFCLFFPSLTPSLSCCGTSEKKCEFRTFLMRLE